jgi:hypothetical protein
MEWKNDYNGSTACLIEGARRVGKTTVVEEFSKKEYETYIKKEALNTNENSKNNKKDAKSNQRPFLSCH